MILKYNKFRRKRVSLSDFALFLVVLIFTFISIDGNTTYQSDFSLVLRKYFVKKREILGFFSPFDLMILLWVLQMTWSSNRFSVNRLKSLLGFGLFIAFLDVLFFILNPYDNLLLHLNRIVLPLFYGLLIILPNDNFDAFVSKVTKYFFMAFMLKALILAYFYWQNLFVQEIHFVKSINLEEDFNIIACLVAALTWAKYLLERRLVYLIAFLLLVVFQVLTFRRTGLMLLVGVASLQMLFYFSLLGLYRKLRLVFSFMLFVGLVAVVAPSQSDQPIYQAYVGRYLGAFIDLGKVSEAPGAHNDHFGETEYAIKELVKHGLPFWGVGFIKH